MPLRDEKVSAELLTQAATASSMVCAADTVKTGVSTKARSYPQVLVPHSILADQTGATGIPETSTHENDPLRPSHNAYQTDN